MRARGQRGGGELGNMSCSVDRAGAQRHGSVLERNGPAGRSAEGRRNRGGKRHRLAFLRWVQRGGYRGGNSTKLVQVVKKATTPSGSKLALW